MTDFEVSISKTLSARGKEWHDWSLYKPNTHIHDWSLYKPNTTVSYNVVSKTLSVRGKEWQTLKCQ